MATLGLNDFDKYSSLYELGDRSCGKILFSPEFGDLIKSVISSKVLSVMRMFDRIMQGITLHIKANIASSKTMLPLRGIKTRSFVLSLPSMRVTIV